MLRSIYSTRATSSVFSSSRVNDALKSSAVITIADELVHHATLHKHGREFQAKAPGGTMPRRHACRIQIVPDCKCVPQKRPPNLTSLKDNRRAHEDVITRGTAHLSPSGV